MTGLDLADDVPDTTPELAELYIDPVLGEVIAALERGDALAFSLAELPDRLADVAADDILLAHERVRAALMAFLQDEESETKVVEALYDLAGTLKGLLRARNISVAPVWRAPESQAVAATAAVTSGEAAPPPVPDPAPLSPPLQFPPPPPAP